MTFCEYVASQNKCDEIKRQLNKYYALHIQTPEVSVRDRGSSFSSPRAFLLFARKNSLLMNRAKGSMRSAKVYSKQDRRKSNSKKEKWCKRTYNRIFACEPILQEKYHAGITAVDFLPIAAPVLAQALHLDQTATVLLEFLCNLFFLYFKEKHC